MQSRDAEEELRGPRRRWEKEIEETTETEVFERKKIWGKGGRRRGEEKVRC